MMDISNGDFGRQGLHSRTGEQGGKVHDNGSVFLSILCALLVPMLFAGYGVQSRRFADVSQQITALEKKQELLIEENKKCVSEISALCATSRIEEVAVETLGMHKAASRDIVRVEMTTN